MPFDMFISRPFTSQVRLSAFYCHTNHGYFMDYRPIENLISYFLSFVQAGSGHFCTNITRPFLKLRFSSAVFTELHTSKISLYDACRSIIVCVSGRCFLIPHIELLVQICISFSVANLLYLSAQAFHLRTRRTLIYDNSVCFFQDWL